MSTVEVPGVGEIEFPDTMSQAEIVSAIQKIVAKPKAGTLERPASLVPIPATGAPPAASMPEEPEPSILDLQRQVFPRETGRKMLPVAGAVAGAMAGGSGLLLPALFAGIGATAGEAGKQKLETGQVDLYDATEEGGKAAAGTLAGGLAFKALGAMAQRIFQPTTLPSGTQKAIEFARKEGVPFPLSARPGLGGAVQETAQKALLPGRVQTIKDATKINTFLNQTVGKLTKEAKAIDEVAVKGQQFFKNIFTGAKEAGEEGFQKFVAKVGQDTEIPIGNFLQAADEAVNAMKSAGIGGALMSKLRTIQKTGSERLTLELMEGVRKDIGKIVRRNNAVKKIGDNLKEAILKDYDEIGAQLGISVRELAEEAIGKFAKFAQLKKSFPQLERFSKQFGERGGTFGSKQWFNELFIEGNAKALNEIRKQSPELYRELSDTWLAQIIERNSVAKTQMFGKVLDGTKFRQYFEQNRNTFKKILGNERTSVLDNFSLYLSNVEDALKASKISGQEAVERMAGEGAGLVFAPQVMVPGEAASYVLAKGLSNPNSQIFKLFTSKPSPQLKKALRTPFIVGGQEAFGSMLGAP